MNVIVYSAVIRSKFKKEYNSLKQCPYIKIDKLDEEK